MIFEGVLRGVFGKGGSGSSSDAVAAFQQYGLGHWVAQAPGALGVTLGFYLTGRINFDDPSGLGHLGLRAAKRDSAAGPSARGSLLATVGDDDAVKTVGHLDESLGASSKDHGDDRRSGHATDPTRQHPDQGGDRGLQRLSRDGATDASSTSYSSTGAERSVLGAPSDGPSNASRPEKSATARPELRPADAVYMTYRDGSGNVHTDRLVGATRVEAAYDEVRIHAPPRQSHVSPPLPTQVPRLTQPMVGRRSERRAEQGAQEDPSLLKRRAVNTQPLREPRPAVEPKQEVVDLTNDQIEDEKSLKIATYDLEPEKTGFKGEDYLGYALAYGLKATIYKPLKAHILGERAMYIDERGNVRPTTVQPDRSAELAVALGQVAMFFVPSIHTPSRLPASMEPATMGGTKLTFLENDVTVEYGSSYTRIGDDWKTIRVTEARQPWPNTHDVIVHAEARGGVVGQRLSPGVATSEVEYELIETHEAQIAEAVRWNPSLKPGQPIRALSCALAPEQAQALANITGHPVYASPWIVGVEAGAGKLPIQQFIRFDYAAGRFTATAEKQVWHLYLPKP